MSDIFRHDNNAAQQTSSPADQRIIQLDNSNTCPIASAKAEIILNCGVNHSWEQRQSDSQVQLANRIILSPFAAKRLAMFFKRGTVNLPGE